MRTTPVILALAAVLSVGCATPERTAVDRHFGKAVNEAKAKQTADPDAPSRRRPTAGVDGAAARTAIEQYEKSFTQPAAQDGVLTTGVGAGGASR